MQRQACDAAVLYRYVFPLASLGPVERRSLPIIGIKDDDGFALARRFDGEAGC